MKMVNNRGTINFLLLFLLAINSVVMFFYIIKISNNRNESDFSNENLNKITLELDIMDIYRLDISCDYITRALSQRVSTRYKNNKKCSLSSLNPNVNELLAQSLNESSKTSSYQPIYILKNSTFEPFATEDLNYYSQFNTLYSGGYWIPNLKHNSKCSHNDLDNIFFIVPFSESRRENLKLFLLNMHSYLQKVTYKFKYRIIVAEQDMSKPNSAFNKGRLINRAIKYVMSNFNQVDCLIIHDVDLIPSNEEILLKERGDYRCRQMPWHLSNEVYSMARKESRTYNLFLTGGILALRPDHFLVSNGFSNMYSSWGGEDDDFTLRMFSSKLCIMRPNKNKEESIAPFVMLEHAASKVNSNRHNLLINALRSKSKDGASNVERLTEIKKIKFFPTFTHLLIDVNEN